MRGSQLDDLRVVPRIRQHLRLPQSKLMQPLWRLTLHADLLLPLHLHVARMKILDIHARNAQARGRQHKHAQGQRGDTWACAAAALPRAASMEASCVASTDARSVR